MFLDLAIAFYEFIRRRKIAIGVACVVFYIYLMIVL